jgi:uncharacterized membrane protein YvlD (DUF360 family)
MKHILKPIIIAAATAYIAYMLIPTINLGTDPKNILFFIGGLVVISQVVNPIFSIVLLPINLLTFGLVTFILNIAFVFALINFLPDFSISAYNFPGANLDGLILPQINLTEIATIVLVALIITIVQKTLHLIFE